jgi:uncharacterized protein (DUF433 family)
MKWSNAMSSNVEPRVVVNPNVMFGKPVIAGTRITVEVILDHLAAGEPIDQLLTEYPRLSRDAILAALRYAADMLRQTAVPSAAIPGSEA